MKPEAAQGKSYEDMTPEDLFALYSENRDPDLKWEIALRYTGLIRSIALQIRGVFCSFTQLDDIINEGLIVLADAVDKFDPEKGRFEMYVAKRIRGMIVDLARQQDWVPRTVRQRAQRIDKAVTEMYNATGKMPTDQEVAEKLGITLEEYREAMANAALHNILSLDEVFDNSDTWEAAADPESGGHPEQALMGEELAATLAKAVSSLKTNEQLVLSLYYERNLKMKDIAAVLEISAPRVSQIHAKAVQKLKVMMSEYMQSG